MDPQQILDTLTVVLLALFVVAFFVKGIVIVPNQKAVIIERLGKYRTTLLAGFHVIIPIIDRKAYVRSLKETVLDVPAQTCITSDNVSVSIDGVIYMQVVDAQKSAYGISDYVQGAVQLAQTSLRSSIGRMPLDKTFESREHINSEVCSDLNAATGSWGVKILRYEIRDLTPPSSIMEAMERQVKAEREKRAVILQSEGEKQSAINIAEGQRASAIALSEGDKMAQTLMKTVIPGNIAMRFFTLQKTIDIIVKQRAVYEVEEGRKAGAEDKVTVNFEGSREGKPFEGGSAEGFQFILAQGRMLPEFEAAVTGMTAGESKTFDLTFPANYGNAELAGKPATFKVECVKVEKPVYPAVDEAFAKSLGIDTVEQMKADIKANLEREVKNRLEIRTQNEVMDALYKLCDFPVPQAFLKDQMRVMAENMLRASGLKDKTIDDVPRELLEEPANRQLHLSMMSGHLIEANKISVSQSEIEARVREAASAYQEPEEMVKWIMKDQNQVRAVAERALEAKLVEFILGKAKTTEETLAFDQLMGNEAAQA